MSATLESAKSVEAPSKQSPEAASQSRPSKRGQRSKLTRGSSVGAQAVRKRSIVKKAGGAASAKVGTKGKRSGVTGGPSTWSMVTEALKSLNERTGSSRIAILNYLVKHFHVTRDARFLSVLRRTLKAKTEQGALRQIGQSFKLPPGTSKPKSEGITRTKSSSIKRAASGETTKVSKTTTRGPGQKRSIKKSAASKPGPKRGGKKTTVSKKGGISKKPKATAKPKRQTVGVSAKGARKGGTGTKKGIRKSHSGVAK